MGELTEGRRSRRGVGSKAGIDRVRIVEAARELPPSSITMQAVADILGVDRSALNHHVKTREQLLQLVAEASFADGFSAAVLRPDMDWQQATRKYAQAYVDAIVSAGLLAEHLSDAFQEDRFLRATETLLHILGSANFADETAVRYVVTLGYIARGFARDRIGVEQGQDERRSAHTQTALRQRDRQDFPNLDRVSARAFDTYGDAQLAAALDAVIAGAAALQRQAGAASQI